MTYDELMEQQFAKWLKKHGYLHEGKYAHSDPDDLRECYQEAFAAGSQAGYQQARREDRERGGMAS